MASLCAALVERANVTVHNEVTVSQLLFDGAGGPYCPKWTIESDADVDLGTFECVVLANHDPLMAADVIDNVQSVTADPELGQPDVRDIIAGFTGQLRALNIAKSSRFSLVVGYERPLSFPFDVVSLHSNGALAFAARSPQGPTASEDHWVAISTKEFAASLDAELQHLGPQSPQFREAATARMHAAWSQIVPQQDTGAPVYAQAKRWGNAFFEHTLELNKDEQTHNDAVTFHPWGLAICGDYLGARQDVECAALSGMMAANRIAGWVAQ